MLYRKHLHPWLLVHIIATVLFFLCTVGVIIVIVVNDISGWFSFVFYSVGTCLYSTIGKLSANMETVLKICFLLSVVGVVVAVGQLGVLVWQFVKFRRLMKENYNDQSVGFKELTLKKLIFLYILSFCGILTMVPVFGWFLSFYIELQHCQQSEDKSSTYLIPWIVAGCALLFQLVSLLLLLKLFYHYRQEEINQQKQSQTHSQRLLREQRQLKAVKKRISHTKKRDFEMGEKEMSPRSYQNSGSTGRHSPRDLQDGLLNQGRKQYPQNNDNTIYGNNSSNQPTTSKMSPNSISARQRQVMKTLPKHPFKKNGQPNFGPHDVIFEESSQGQEEEQEQEPHSPIKSLATQETQRKSPQQNIPISELFRQRYLNSPYLRHLENKAISPQQRRAIKRPFLKLSGSQVQFDAKNYEVDDITLDVPRKKRHKPIVIVNERKRSEELKTPVNQKCKGSINGSISQQLTSPRKPPNSSRSSRSLLPKSIINDKNLQNQNPIVTYVQQDETYQDKLSKILQFQKLTKLKRNKFTQSSFFNRQSDKQQQGKLYLHKNKIDSSSHAKNLNLNQDDQQNEGYDPFRDAAYDDQSLTYRGLTEEDAWKGGAKSEIKRTNTKELDGAINQMKKVSRKDGMLLEFIRSKHVID